MIYVTGLMLPAGISLCCRQPTGNSALTREQMSSLKGDQLHSCGNILLLRALINNQINLLDDAQQTLDWTFWMLSRDWWIKALQASPVTCCCFQKLCSQHPLLCDHRTVTQRWKEAWEGRAGLSKMPFMFKSLRLKSFLFWRENETFSSSSGCELQWHHSFQIHGW